MPKVDRPSLKRIELTESLREILIGAERILGSLCAQAIVFLADSPFDFAAIKQLLPHTRVIVASGRTEVQQAARDDGMLFVPLDHEPESRRLQLTQALLESIADELLQTGDRVVALYPGFERTEIDTISVINLGEQLARLTSRDLQRLETQVPLETLRSVVDLAVEIGREGREGKPVGAIFVVGNHRKVLALSHEQVHDPFRGYSAKERMIRDPRVRESIKEIAQLDGAFVISADGIVQSAGRNLDAPMTGINISKGLGSRHCAAAAISKVTNAVAVAVSESTGTVRVFQHGEVVLRIEPMMRAMKWQHYETDSATNHD